MQLNQDYAPIACCNCGTVISPNPANMCIACLKSEVDITKDIPKHAILCLCSKCDRFLNPPSQWVHAALESKELLSLCLKRLKGLAKVRLVDATFVWTEPHSKRLRVKVVVQQEVHNGAVLQQAFEVEYTLQNQQCPDCTRVAAQDYWKANVQVRQKTNHRKTLYYLEQLILKHDAHKDTVNIKQETNGMDFYFATKTQAVSFADFLSKKVPCRLVHSQQLISHDIHNNTYNYRHTICVEIAPICKDDIVVLPKNVAQRLGNMGQICVISRVTDKIHLIDPQTCQICEVDGKSYFQNPFVPLCSLRHLTEYIVLELEPVPSGQRILGSGHARLSEKHVPADVYVLRASDMSSEQLHARTHLGHLLSAGDTVMGFDIANSNTNHGELEKMNMDKCPDVVLVKKVYGERVRRHQKRQWRLKRLHTGASTSTTGDEEYVEFLEDLEEDPETRKEVRIYIDRMKPFNETPSDDMPQISLAEMLDDLKLDTDVEMADS